MSIPLIPLEDQLVVQELDQERDMVSQGGIVMQSAQQNKDNSRKAKVLAVGPGRTLETTKDGQFLRKPISAKVGDIIIYREFTPMQVTIKGTPYMILGADNIVGIIPEGTYDS